MTKLTQKEAVYQAVTNVVEFDGLCQPTKEERAQVNEILFQGFKAGTIAYDGDIPADQALRSYVSGLQSNWLRKDARLNGNVKYVAKNPGSRTGSGDKQLIAMKALLAVQTNPTAIAEITAEIEKRKAELKPKVEIDANNIPEELKKYLTK
jgi:hypothetical protein